MTLLKNIEKLVAEVAEAATLADVPLHDKMDALKLLQPYYAALKKAEGKPADDDGSEGGLTMSGMRRRLHVVEQEPADGSRVETSSRRPRDTT